MKDDKHLIERPIASEPLFQGSFLRAVRDTVELPNGKQATREYILHPGAVMMIPLLDDGRIVLERQYRHPVGEVLIEFPAGKLDAGEDPLACGQRELLEETGYTAREWAKAGALKLAVGYSDEVIHIYFARGLTLTKPQLDEGEFVEVITATPEELLAWCRDGLVKDSKTLVGALWVQNVLSGDWPLSWHG
jgi:ADP-ribose pyrophosphatase